VANKENISLLSKYQMKVLYHKCKEGATHEEIAEILGRDVKTVQYHMTKIYKILEITGPGKSKEEMDSELKNEICPIIRQKFPTYDDIKIWAPSTKKTPDKEKEEAASPYQPPPSLEKVLRQAENQASTPGIIESPPPARRRINGRRVIILLIIGLVIIAGWGIFSHNFTFVPRPIDTPTQTTLTQSSVLLKSPVFQTITPTVAITISPIPPATQTAAPTPIEIITEISPVDGMVLVFVPEGEFKMGSSKADDPQALDEEIPQHNVYLDAYWIDQTEVTNAQYAKCVASGFCSKPSDIISLTHSSYYDNPQYAHYPVIFVSWSQASTYCTWAGRRLPTEAMWEKAARGPDGFIYPWEGTFDGTKANYCDINCINGWKDDRYDDGYIDTSPVGDYPAGASIYGVFDMAGNAYEWVADWFEPYRRIRQENPTGPLSGSEHIIRGGSWGDDPAHIRAATRSHVNVPDNSNFIGFRCAVDQK
jgi:formylglycine-generating enzyme required for sulfatase activity/DNA-binding CsgD family transcriptional regulator